VGEYVPALVYLPYTTYQNIAGKNTVYKLIKENRLSAMRVGKSWLIPHAALDKFIKTSSGLE